MPPELVTLILEFHDEHNVKFKRKRMNQHFKNYFCPDWAQDL